MVAVTVCLLEGITADNDKKLFIVVTEELFTSGTATSSSTF